MTRVKHGDLEELAVLYERYNRILYGFFFKATLDAQASEDLVHTVFFKIIKYRERYRAEQGPFATWMFRIAHNANVDYFHSRKHARSEARIDLLASEVQEMKKTVTLAKLQNPVAAERMKAVGLTADLSGPDEVVLDALIQTMNGDPNVNVRLVSVEALARYAENPKVREALVQAIVRQDSPLVQLALADIMLAMNEKRAVEPFRKVIADPGLDYAVKSKLENAVRLLL